MCIRDSINAEYGREIRKLEQSANNKKENSPRTKCQPRKRAGSSAHSPRRPPPISPLEAFERKMEPKLPKKKKKSIKSCIRRRSAVFQRKSYKERSSSWEEVDVGSCEKKKPRMRTITISCPEEALTRSAPKLDTELRKKRRKRHTINAKRLSIVNKRLQAGFNKFNKADTEVDTSRITPQHDEEPRSDGKPRIKTLAESRTKSFRGTFVPYTAKDYSRLLEEELIKTEVDYVNHLKTIVTVYSQIQGLRSKERREAVTIIFSQIPKLYKLHQELLDDLQSGDQNDMRVLSFTRYLDSLYDVYVVYVTNFETQSRLIHLLQDKSKTFKKITEKLSLTPPFLSLESYLIMPIQRLPRYEMLLLKLVEFSNKELAKLKSKGKPCKELEKQHNEIVMLMESIKQLNEMIDTYKGQAENAKNISRLQMHLQIPAEFDGNLDDDAFQWTQAGREPVPILLAESDCYVAEIGGGSALSYEKVCSPVTFMIWSDPFFSK
eukprot:TRINITY_DN1937_c0_g1_i5.p1 TRINITY_DN1937_c0_g1~~TRINITY_DN1937_c0_g1_i5.p1  ORF type:complete len:492 (+),score=93.94 TRINITY_DN1937_c0_g1_i5:41-1516(+)